MSELYVISGTGTEIGKTHLTRSLVLQAVANGLRVAAYKPVESGAVDGAGPDQRALMLASATLHLPQPSYSFAAPLSPHRAALMEHSYVDIARIVHRIDVLAREHDATFVELAGGLFTPLDEERNNFDVVVALAKRCQPKLIVVAPNRLGVLHDTLCLQVALTTAGLAPAAFALVEQPSRDASAPTNAADLAARATCTVHTIPRRSAEALANSIELKQLWTALTTR